MQNLLNLNYIWIVTWSQKGTFPWLRLAWKKKSETKIANWTNWIGEEIFLVKWIIFHYDPVFCLWWILFLLEHYQNWFIPRTNYQTVHLQFTFGQREFDCVQFCGDEDQHVVHLNHLDQNDCRRIKRNKIDGEWKYFFLGDQLFFPHMNLSAWEPPWRAPNQHFSNYSINWQWRFGFS